MKHELREIAFWLILVFLLAFGVVFGVKIASAQPQCDFYASPTGAGTVGSAANPFKISEFWNVAGPGSTLCLMDGVYTGADSMINPTPGMSGTAAGRITIRALNDGMVKIDGQGFHRPIYLENSDYFVIEGMNAANSSATVVQLNDSDYNIVRRVVAWDAADGGNHKIFQVTNGGSSPQTDGHNLLEDVAGFGIARKTFSSYTANHTTIRRAWGSWDGSHYHGPKMTFTLAYNNTNAIYENVIGTWTGSRLTSATDQMQAVIGTDGLHDSQQLANSKLLGSIGYVRSSPTYCPNGVNRITQPDGVHWENVVSYVEPGDCTIDTRAVGMLNFNRPCCGLPTQRTVTNATAIGGEGNSYHGSTLTNVVEYATIADMTAAGVNIYTGATGAKVCKRYVDGVLTDEPLWPWPMNQRIIDAMIDAGRTPVDVTAEVETMFGAIPAECKTAPDVDPKQQFCDDMSNMMQQTMAVLITDMNNLVTNFCSAN